MSLSDTLFQTQNTITSDIIGPNAYDYARGLVDELRPARLAIARVQASLDIVPDAEPTDEQLDRAAAMLVAAADWRAENDPKHADALDWRIHDMNIAMWAVATPEATVEEVYKRLNTVFVEPVETKD
jgi:hypothetical protein